MQRRLRSANSNGTRRRPTGYGGEVATVVRPVPKPEMLDRFEGMWVAVIDGEVAAAEHTSHKLAIKLRQMDHRRRACAVIEYVRPATDSYIVGVG
jgi:hypothetical protein